VATDIGIVVEKKNSGRGTPMLKIGSQWYVAGNLDVSGVNVGHKLDFEWKELPSNDSSRPPMRGIQKWAFTPDQPTPVEVEAAKAASAPKGKLFVKGGGGFSKEKDRDLEIDLQCMRFVGQICGAAIEKGLITQIGAGSLEQWATGAWNAIKFTRALGGTAPAPATSSSGQNATPAGSPQQPPQGGPPPAPSPPPPQLFVGNPNNPRPTGLFGYGKKYKDTPWNVLETSNLQFFLGSNAPAEVKQKCADELWHREQEKLRADQVQQSMAGPEDPNDWDSDIPF
jgi:hypothetical protein